MKYLFLLLSLSLLSFAHQGRLNSHGGHKNKSTDKYHYHTSKKGKNIDPFYSPIRIQILKYGADHGWGRSFHLLEGVRVREKDLQERMRELIILMFVR